jgi:hypothetical protein
MTKWKQDELRKIAATQEPEVSVLLEDGATKPIPIWAVVVGDVLYARSYKGAKGRWYQSALRNKAGRIAVEGASHDVTFEPVDGTINDWIDDAYRAKYGHSPYLAPMLSDEVRATTLKIAPRA